MKSSLLREPQIRFIAVLFGPALLIGACSDDDHPEGEGSTSGGAAGRGVGGASAGTKATGGNKATGGRATGGTAGSAAHGGASSAVGGDGEGGEAGTGQAGNGGAGGNGGTGDNGKAGGSGGVGEGGVGGAGASVGGAGGAEAELVVATPEDLTDESAADYADNDHGVITGATLKSWVQDWDTNRPAGVSGRLVLLQIVPNVAASQFHAAGNGTSVVSYLVPQAELTKLRNNGLSQIEAEIPDGPATDALLKKYGIDPVNDFVVLTFEELPAVGSAPATTNAIVQQVGRAWLLLRYWGHAAERVGLLNGSVNWNATNQGLQLLASSSTATPPNDGTVSVRELRVDNTALVITLGELLDTLQSKPSARPLGEVTIVDARGGAEALGLLKATSTGKTDCPSYTGTGANTRCSPLFEGRIKGAHSVPWPQFLESAANSGFRFLSKAAVKATFDAQSGYEPGDLTIQYCRTNVRSMVTGIVASVILGYPTRFYDTSFIEWSHLAYGPTLKKQTLPEGSPFRTDLATLTEHANVTGYTPGLAYDASTMPVTGWVSGPNYNADDDISPTVPLIVPTATTTAQSVSDDRAYKL